ncbi:MAG: NAD(P)-dependent oxidoreductase, partial [Planctomycetota bacterium]
WTRQTGTELAGKTLGVIGVGRIGREVIKRGRAFGMPTMAYSRSWDEDFATEYGLTKCDSAEQVLTSADVVSLHVSLADENRGFINAAMIEKMKDTAILINTARGGLVVEEDVAAACKAGRLGGYGADVIDVEPMQTPHPYQGVDNIMLTPHIGSRTVESVGRQAMRATKNLVNFLNGDSDFIQANRF